MSRESHHALVVFAPVRGDADTLRAIVENEGVQARVCADAPAFYAALDEGALAITITEEGLARCSLQDLSARLGYQPNWSDIPVLVLAGADSRDVDTDRFARLAGIGNVTLLTRPTTRLALVMAVRAALRTRQLQFAVRDQLDQLASDAARLETIVDERTRSLEHEVAERRRIEQTLAEARRLESLGQLTGGIAHDFNNILQVVAGSETLLRMLFATTPDPRVTRALDGIRRATTHGASLTQQLLAYARRQPLASVVLDIAVHLRATADMIRRILGPGKHLRIEIAPNAWKVLADPTQLDAALLNIAGNARDAMPDGGTLTLEVRNWMLPDETLVPAAHLAGEFVSLCMTDDGTGMSEDTARQAFEPFFTTKPVGKGTGLGLSQVYGFAIQSHGMAFIRREAVGTTVGILLPRSRDVTPARSADRGFSQDTGLENLRILCVEDDHDVAESTVAILQSLGASVRLVHDADAVTHADLSEIDLVFSDVMMPGELDGIDLAHWMAREHPQLPVVLTSGYMLSPERLKALDVPFVRKPFAIGTIIDTFAKALRQRAASGGG